mmetsp:Transcript_9228/g.13677  ORF Transcript_9228/g.13677 Transcript_9228/m.13677 type:complete len:535 (-) Transcript_9228:15-1619(-)
MSRQRDFGEDHLSRESVNASFNPKKRKLLNRGSDEMKKHYEEDFDDGYDSDYIGDEADRKYLESLSESDREDIILKRFENREKLKEKKEQLRKNGLLYSRSAKAEVKMDDYAHVEEEPKKKKPKAFFAKDAVYDYSEVKPMLDNLKREREEIAKRAEAKQKKMNESHGAGMDESIANYKKMMMKDEEDDDPTYVDQYEAQPRVRGGRVQHSQIKKKRGQLLPSIDDVARIMISRNAIEHWLYEPYLSKILTGSFVKMLVGIHEEVKVYRLVEIINLEPMDTIYALGERETNVLAEVRLAKDTMKETLEKISNQPLTVEEYDFWVNVMRDNHCKFPTLEFIDSRASLLQSCAEGTYEYTHEERQELIEREKRFRIYTMNDSLNTLVQARAEVSHRLENHNNGSFLLSAEDLEADQQKYEQLNHLISEKKKSKKEEKKLEFERLRASQTPEERRRLKILEQIKELDRETAKTSVNKKKDKKKGPDPFSRLSINYSEKAKKPDMLSPSPVETDDDEENQLPEDAVKEEHDFDLDIDI